MGHGQSYGCHQPKKGRDTKGKPPKNNIKCKNELMPKIGPTSKLPWCVLTKDIVTNKTLEE
jgi:hypothetical protein